MARRKRRFYAYNVYNKIFPLTKSFIMTISQNPLPKSKRKFHCSGNYPLLAEEGIGVGKKYRIAIGDPSFPGKCLLVAKDLREAPKDILSKIPWRVQNHVKMAEMKFPSWWLWLRPDGSWLLASPRNTALAYRIL